VTSERTQRLPEPTDFEWMPEPVKVFVPWGLPREISCVIDGKTLHSGENIESLPGKTIEFTYRQDGYEDMKMPPYQVGKENAQHLPVPLKWKLKPVTVSVQLPDGVTCSIDGKNVNGDFLRVPYERVKVVYHKNGFEDVERLYNVTLDIRQALPVPSDGEWRPSLVRVSMPADLPDGVTLWLDGRRRVEPIVAKPGTLLECTWKRDGYRSKVENYPVSRDSYQMLHGPKGEWEALLVSIEVPMLESGIEILVDGKPVVPGNRLALSPGRHVCLYRRADHEPQEMRFSVSHAKAEWPRPGKWTEAGSLKFISQAEEALGKGDPEKAKELLRHVSADRLSSANKKRIEAINVQSESLRGALFCMDESNEDWSGALSNFYISVVSGYRLTETDWSLVQEAFSKARNEPVRRIKEWEWYREDPFSRRNPFGERGPQMYDKAKEELKLFTGWYNECEKKRR